MTTWYGVRSVYHFGVKPDGVNIFEERIVCFAGASFEEVLEKAQRESENYARDNNFEWYPVNVAYEQHGDPVIEAYEVWSELYEARESLETFWNQRYGRYEYFPQIES